MNKIRYLVDGDTKSSSIFKPIVDCFESSTRNIDIEYVLDVFHLHLGWIACIGLASIVHGACATRGEVDDKWCYISIS